MTERKQSFWYTVLMVAPFVWSVLMITQYKDILHLDIICMAVLSGALVYYLFSRKNIKNSDIYSALKVFALFCAYMCVISISTNNFVYAFQTILVLSATFSFSFAGYDFKRYSVMGYLYALISFLLVFDFSLGGFTAGVNTNTISLFAINGVMYMCLINDMQNNRHIIPNGIIIAIILVFISKTGCRSVYIAFFVYLLLRYIIFSKKKINKYFFRVICALAMCMPYILMRIYLGLYNSPYKDDLNNFFFEHTGKIMFTERELVWKYVFSLLNGVKYWLGYGTRCANAHNLLVDVWYCYGLIGVVIYVSVFLYIIYKLYKHFDDHIIKSSVCCFLGIVVSETFECFSFALAVEAFNIMLYLFLAIAIGRYVYLENRNSHERLRS